MTKKRLDALVAEKYPQLSRTHIQSLVMQGKVRVNDQVSNKPGTPTPDDAKIDVLIEEQKYVSRAGFKLEAALKDFGVDVKDRIALDAGISTGGFTDCLLQNGIKRVYGVDVGFGQVHEKINKDPRLILIEKTNLRFLDKLPEQMDLATLDLSFISLLKVMPAVVKLLKPDGKIIALIKPQFEAEREDIGKNGLVKDAEIHKKVVEKIRTGMLGFGFEMKQVIESPIKGAASGNIEFLALLERKC